MLAKNKTKKGSLGIRVARRGSEDKECNFDSFESLSYDKLQSCIPTVVYACGVCIPTDFEEKLMTEESIEFNTSIAPFDRKLQSMQDLQQALAELRCMGAKEVPQNIMIFCFSNAIDSCKELLEDCVSFMPQLKVLITIVSQPTHADRMVQAAKIGDLEVMKAIESTWEEDVTCHTSQHQSHQPKTGILRNFTKLFRSKRKSTPKRNPAELLWTPQVCEVAAASGHTACLIHAHQRGAQWSEKVCSDAARRGHLKCLKYAHENGCPWDSCTIELALTSNHQSCLLYALEQGCPAPERSETGILFTTTLARRGLLDCLRAAHARNLPWDADTCAVAAEYGHLECLRFVHENGCPWNDQVLAHALAAGQMKCFLYARDHGATCHYMQHMKSSRKTSIASSSRGSTSETSLNKH